MGEAKRREEQGLETQTVRLPALTRDEVRLIHDMMHRQLHQLQAVPPEQADEAHQARLSAMRALHHKLFAH